eukprot:5725254-Pleurochrysis_carterae.AAC.1
MTLAIIKLVWRIGGVSKAAMSIRRSFQTSPQFPYGSRVDIANSKGVVRMELKVHTVENRAGARFKRANVMHQPDEGVPRRQ